MNLINRGFGFLNKNLRFYFTRLSSISMLVLMPLILSAQKKATFDFMSGVEFSNRYDRGSIRNTSIFQLGINSEERGGIGNRFGVGFSDQITKDVHVEVGLATVISRFKTYSSWDQSVVANHSFFLVEFPFVFRYEYVSQKFTPYVKFGGALNILGNSSTVFVANPNNKSPYLNDINIAHFNLMMGGGYNYAISDLLQLFFDFNIRYALTGLEKNKKYDEHLYNIGIGLGFRRNFYQK